MARAHKPERNKRRSDRVIAFIEKLTVPSGVGQGKPFKLRPWQKRFIRDVYEPHEDGKRQVRRAVLSVARKNGKTALIAALVLAHLIGPESVANGEIYSAANEREQAGIVFKFAAQLVRADPELEALLKVVDSTKTIACYSNGSFYRAISAEAGSKHGLNPSVVIYDELAQARNRELYDVLDTSMGAREEPLFITISTQSNDPQHILSTLIDDGLRSDDPTTVTHLYAVPDDEEDIFDKSAWKKANPALNDFRSLPEMKTMADRALRMPSFESTFRNLYLNQRVDSQSPLIPRAEWMACQGDEQPLRPGERIYLGLDLSTTADLTALVAVSAEDGDRLGAWFWKPKDLVGEHEKRDRAPYRAWATEGHLLTTPGRVVNFGFVAAVISELGQEYDIAGIAYDRWRIEYLMKDFASLGIEVYRDGKQEPFGGALRLCDWGQGYRDMAPAIDALETAVMDRRLVHPGNPVLTMCFANAITDSDPAGNRKFDKAKTRLRIDGAVATAMAMGLKARDAHEVPPTSPWDDPDFKLEHV